MVKKIYWIVLFATLAWSLPALSDQQLPDNKIKNVASMDAITSACLYTALIPDNPTKDIRSIIDAVKNSDRMDIRYYDQEYRHRKESLLFISREQFEELCEEVATLLDKIYSNYKADYCTADVPGSCG